MKTALVIMAAGIGSRFGGGIKQLAAVGPNGEIIMDYSIHDAIEAGFDKIVFIIRHDIEEAFKEAIGNRIEKTCADLGIEIAYAFQEKDAIPAGYEVPAERSKPWGTGQAVLACKNVIKEPFAVINADDYYGKEAFVQIHNFLQGYTPDKPNALSMAGFVLKNTLSDNGAVTRGICQMNEAHYLTGVLETSGIEQEDWQNAWKKYYHAMDIGQRLAIVPGWETYDTDRIVITMDPGMAFGTGTHETTSLCLETLDSMVKGGERVLDIGTGSGILAIAALKLGAAEAEGVDIDPMCVRTAGENAERNGVAEHFTVLVGDLSDKASGKYNIITANIVAAAILSLAPHVPVLMAPGARFIASGIIDTRKDEVLAGLRAAGLEPVEIKEKRGWVCVICKNAAEV